jgi:hypothetical protein
MVKLKVIVGVDEARIDDISREVNSLVAALRRFSERENAPPIKTQRRYTRATQFLWQDEQPIDERGRHG